MPKKKMKFILGTMTFGPQVNNEDSYAMIKHFIEAGFTEIDTAYVYNEGETERILGSVLSDYKNTIHIATKVHPRITGKLDAEAVEMQLTESLRRLKRDYVDILYLHIPDDSTPIEATLEACNRFHQQGKFIELGLSNFPAWMVVDIWHLCDKNRWITPGVYQGLYNGLSRKIEYELMPAIRKLDIRFYAYNPLAGGILSGKHTEFEENPLPGRFTYRPHYRDRYWKKSFFEAVNELRLRCKDISLELPEASIRWLAFHSDLDSNMGDGIIIGVSKINHLKQNLSAVEKGPLPENIISAFQHAWEIVKPDSPEYFRHISL